MSETKNNAQQAITFASGLTVPTMSPYSNSGTSISVSDGIAIGDINTILAQTGELMATFEASLKADAKNILSASDAYEKADQMAKQVIENGR
ncbi:DUF3130 family protein [Enterococcus sp. BWR-S5]|uniref:DUF3130 family protein n=1 Tax=Enterococcus sp. BWR-S5 TaxID=2787714 RepID=UPI001923C4B5|nr:DUF3130 family protein [Enterococcus sp. BWR-S5]MBL1226809.1 DUF3130 family protein [Enterococcus sp. BWR-S5]